MRDIVNLLIVILVTLLPVIIWGYVLLRADKKQEPLLLLVLAFLVGGLSTVPVLLLKIGVEFIPFITLSITGLSLVASIIFSATIEEVSKHVVATKVIGTHHEGHNEITDGIVYGMIVGLGFAFVENAVYFWESYQQYGDLFSLGQLYLIRSVHTMVAHALFSGIFGYFYALGYICPDSQYIKSCVYRISGKAIRETFDVKTMLLRATRTIVLKKEGEYYFDGLTVVLEGGIIAVLLHAVYNIILATEVFGDWYLVVLSLYLFLLGYVLMSRLWKGSI